ncbi:MAG TPA: universal stress protein [Pyrinomonadaceae bacterium]|nr:universal stress protein [Pyrinomonadaceae bacterium]
MSDTFKILIAYDGSNFADAALDDLRSAGLPQTVEALVLCVAEVWLPPQKNGEPPVFVVPELKAHYEENLEVFAAARDLAEAAARRVGTMFPNWTITAEATYGSAAWEILFRAEDFKPDLIVVGAQGVVGLKELLIGSVAQKIVTEAPCSVRVARGRVEVEPSPARLIVGYDGTAGADRAVASIAERQWAPGTEVRVVLVQDTALIRKSFEIEDEHVERIGRSVADRLEGAGLKASLAIVEGNPKSLIVGEAKTFGADAIFLGATRFDDVLTKYLLGSVASAIVTRAHCSVEIVRGKRGQDFKIP